MGKIGSKPVVKFKEINLAASQMLGKVACSDAHSTRVALVYKKGKMPEVRH